MGPRVGSLDIDSNKWAIFKLPENPQIFRAKMIFIESFGIWKGRHNLRVSVVLRERFLSTEWAEGPGH